MPTRNRARWASIGALALTAVALAAGPLAPDPTQKPLAWGPFTLTVRTLSQFAQRATLTTAGGRVLKSFRAAVITARLEDVTGDGVKELHVNLYSGGAHCCTTDIYDQLVGSPPGGVTNLLVFDGGNAAVERWSDLNGDGRLEAVASSDALAYFGDLAFAYSPGVRLVLAWNGARYTDATRRYPNLAVTEARDYQGRYLQARAAHDPDLQHAAALGYLANMTVAGQEPAANAWLRAHALPADRAWLTRYASDLQAALAATPAKVRQSQARDLGDGLK